MKRIQVLSKHIANQIAAGEVVERPASIIKELVENSIDAGSTAVTVEIKGGGIEYIRVTDNGSGIVPEDVPTAFLRHATSKISTADDLAHIDTLGFRGEALASIAAVSQLSLKTRAKDADVGTLIRIEGGEVRECVEAGCTDGTSIEIRNVFYNVPARLKFLKSQRAEAGYISDYVARAILGNPGISFKLISNDKLVYHSSGNNELESAVYCIYGADVLPHLKKVTYSDGRITISGFLGTEKLARPNRQQQSLFINSRYVRSPQVSFAVQRAFDTRLMSGKFPFYVLNLALDVADVDVNVHPNKMEVRFKDDSSIARAATVAARMALGDPVAPVLFNEDVHLKNSASHNFVRTPENAVSPSKLPQPEMFAQPPRTAAKVKDSAPAAFRRPETMPLPAADFGKIQPIELAEKISLPMNSPVPEVKLHQVQSAPKPVAPVQLEFGCEPYSIIGQIFNCYWAVQQGNSVFFIDQHAAHERRLYEALIAKPLSPDSQMLLMPVIEKLTPLEFETLNANMERFIELGFDIEEFGVLTVSVRAVPAIINAPEAADFLHEAIGRLEEKNRLTTIDLKRASLIQAACKHAIKAGAVLAKEEIESLLKEYAAGGVPMTCPHGRPVMVCMSKLEFEKLFKRVI